MPAADDVTTTNARADAAPARTEAITLDVEAPVIGVDGTHRRSMARAFAVHALPLLGYVAIGFAFTIRAWPDPAHTWAGNTGDNFQFMNFLAWTPHAVGTLQNPLFMPLLNYPRGANLTWNTAMPLGAIVAWPVTALFGPVVSFNTVAVASIALDGWCTFLWLRRRVRSIVAAFIGGFLLALGPFIPAHLTQLSLLSFWPVPLTFIVTERLIGATRRSALWGSLLGVLGAVQLYLDSELVALAAIAIAVALVIAAVLNPSAARARWRSVAIAVAAAIAVFSVLAAPFVLYQLNGPYPIRGPIQPPNTYVADLQNFVVATPATWLWPHQLTRNLTTSWTGVAEATAYIGVPLLLVAVYALARWWRERLVVTVALATALMLLLSLGPHLHIGGVDTGIRLPAVVLAHLPLLDKMLPVRFALIADFGLAVLLAITLERTLLRAPLRAWLGSALALLGAISTVSVVAVPASSAEIPQYFSRVGLARSLPRGTVALVGPYTDDGAATAVPMLWQAESDFRFALIGGLVITGDDQGHPEWVLSSPIRDAFHQIQAGGTLPQESPALRTTLLQTLHRSGVTTVILGPMPHRDLASSFVTWLAGHAPSETQGVLLWSTLPSSSY
jgi:hypothetical protein